MADDPKTTEAPIPFEIAARAICRHVTSNYPKTRAGQDRADAYVDANWRAIWETLPSVKIRKSQEQMA
jgi:hypothetical protein